MSTPKPGELFGELSGPAPERITHKAKLDELRREAKLRDAVYPKQVAAGRLDEKRAQYQRAVLTAILADYEIQPWPSTRQLVELWRPKAEPLTVLGVRAVRMHRDELLAVLAFAVDALKQAGLLGETIGANSGTNGAKRETEGP